MAEGRHQRPAEDDDRAGDRRSRRPAFRRARSSRFNASPWFTTRIIDLIGVKDRQYLDATATHRNRGPEDIARYGILVTVAEDGAIGPHPFRPARDRRSDGATATRRCSRSEVHLFAAAAAESQSADELTARGEQVFARAGCASCHTPPLYTNNKLVPVDGFTPFEHPSSPPAADVMQVQLGLDPGLALRTRKGTGYYKVPSLKGRLVPRPARAFGIDRVARGVVRSGVDCATTTCRRDGTRQA